MNETKSVQVVKSTNDELKQATFIVMLPDEVDMHGDITSEEEVRKACHNFNEFCRQPNLFHIESTELFSIVESYISPVDFKLNEEEVKKGTWLATIQVKDDNLWALIKSGEISGLSIGAIATVETLDE